MVPVPGDPENLKIYYCGAPPDHTHTHTHAQCEGAKRVSWEELAYGPKEVNTP